MPKLKFLTCDIGKICFSKIFILLLPIVVLMGFGFFFLDQSILPILSSPNPHVIIDHAIIDVETADSFEAQIQGLSGREYLGANDGMLFRFGSKMQRQFWMKQMLFPIDIIWIDGDTVVDIDARLEPEGENPSNRYSPPVPVDIILEVNGGLAEAYGIEAGDKVIYNLE